MINTFTLGTLSYTAFFFPTGHKQGRSDHTSTQVRTSKSEKKLFSLFLYLTYVFICL